MSAKKILIIDDDRDQRLGLQVCLEAHGYDVVGASDAVQAMSVALKELPDLALLDIGLPGGDGHKALNLLQSLTPTSTLPVIVLSAMEPAQHRDRMLKAGAIAYFQTPVGNAALLATIDDAIGSVQPAAHLAQSQDWHFYN